MITRKEIRSRSGKILLYILFLLELLPDVFRENFFFNIAFYGIRAIGGLVSMMLFLTSKRKSKSICFLAIYIVYLLLITFLRSFSVSNLVRFVAIYADIFVVAVFTEYLIQRDTKRFLKVLWVYCWIGLIINCLTVFLFPNGLYVKTNELGVPFPFFFYGYDNFFIYRYIPSILIFYYYEKKCYASKHSSRTFVAIVLCFVSILYRHSVGPSIAMGVVFLGFLAHNLIPNKITPLKKIWIGYVAVASFLTLGSLNEFLAKYISWAGKIETMERRAKMWSIGFEAISNNALFGKGVLDTFSMREMFKYAQLHNTLLTTLLWGGIIGVILYSFFIISLQDGQFDTGDATDKRIIAVLFLGLMIASLVDGVELSSHVYLFYFIVANYAAVVKYLDTPDNRQNDLPVDLEEKIILDEVGYEHN